MSTQKVDASIMGQSYILAAPTSEVADLQLAVAKVDEAMCKIRDAGKIKARERIAVLAALNLAFDHQQQSMSAAAPVQAPLSAEQRDLDLAQAEQRLGSLLQRLDMALGESGLLL